MKPHKHAELIHAWADGAEIELSIGEGPWVSDPKPNWHINIHYEYRIKPEKKWYRVAEKLYSPPARNVPFLVTAKAVETATSGDVYCKWITDRIYYE